jgi:ankyrin repeat protein
VDINIKDKNGRTPLHHAVQSGQSSVVLWLLEEGNADVYVRDIWGRTAMDIGMEDAISEYLRQWMASHPPQS